MTWPAFGETLAPCAAGQAGVVRRLHRRPGHAPLFELSSAGNRHGWLQVDGMMGGVFAIASVAGALLGGWFTERPGWRLVFWINTPCAS